ncbi:MAG TPA: hypothetical protein VHF50_00330 [Solirubrobacterales bacterium]|nr:hypothetical protein [Solirubrobacterales bacterium]
MGILDDAIKEHLELKRQHGADDSELKKLEDEAFGAAERPGTEGAGGDSVAEAPTQFMSQPDLEAPEHEAEAGEEATDAASDAEEAAPAAEEPSARPRMEIADLQEPPVESVEEIEDDPSEEQSPAMEHEAIAEAPAREPAPAEPPAGAEESQAEISAGPSTEERHAIAEHPTEMYDVEAELGETEPTDAEPEVRAVAEEDLSEEDEEFWDEKRLSDELDQALEAPVELQEPDLVEAPEATPQPEPTDDDAEEPESAHAEGPEPARTEEGPRTSGKQDVLDETPDFLEEKPEDADLWFEQKPPKDFDFDD